MSSYLEEQVRAKNKWINSLLVALEYTIDELKNTHKATIPSRILMALNVPDEAVCIKPFTTEEIKQIEKGLNDEKI